MNKAMTEERKNEILDLIKNDNYADIGRKEAEAFFTCITNDERELVEELVNKHRKRREMKEEREREHKFWSAQNEHMWALDNLVRIFKKDLPTLDDVKCAKNIVFEFLTEKEAMKKEIEGIGSWYECPDCTTNLRLGQPFCINCGRRIVWYN